MILSAKVPHNLVHKPRSFFRLKIWKLVNHRIFEISIMSCIMLNMLQMAVLFEGYSNAVGSFLKFTNYIFTVIFLVEAILKMIAYGRHYFGTGWNRFDFFVVICGIFDIVVSDIEFETDMSSSSFLSVGP